MKLAKLFLIITFATAQQTGNGIEISLTNGLVATIKPIEICFRRQIS